MILLGRNGKGPLADKIPFKGSKFIFNRFKYIYYLFINHVPRLTQFFISLPYDKSSKPNDEAFLQRTLL
jgi:hypothetical protein